MLLKSDPSNNGLVSPLWRHTEIALVRSEVDLVTLVAQASERVLWVPMFFGPSDTVRKIRNLGHVWSISRAVRNA